MLGDGKLDAKLVPKDSFVATGRAVPCKKLRSAVDAADDPIVS